jgi:hypothetical protein
MRIPFFFNRKSSEKTVEETQKKDCKRNQKISEADITPAARCGPNITDLRSPHANDSMNSAVATEPPEQPPKQAASAPDPDINLAYHYDDNDILSLLTRGLAEPIANDTVAVGIPAENLNRVYEGVTLWHKQCQARTAEKTPAILLLPYSPERVDGLPCNHWSVLALTQAHSSDKINIAYVDPLEHESTVPNALKSLIAHAFGADQVVSHSIQHTAQRDTASCGPRIVEDATELAHYYCQHKKLPQQLKNAEHRDARAIREQHLTTLGGADSTFGVKQRRWQPPTQPLTTADASVQNTFRGALLELLPMLSEKEHRIMSAAPSLETLERLGVKVPREYDPCRAWANRFLADYEKTRATQTTFIDALEACKNIYPCLFETLSKTWQTTQEGFPVLKIIRGDMKGLIDANSSSAWESPEANVLTLFSKTFFKSFQLVRRTTPEQLDAAEFAEMELVEWAFARMLKPSLEKDLESISDKTHASATASVGSKHSDSTHSHDSFEDLYGLYS